MTKSRRKTLLERFTMIPNAIALNGGVHPVAKLVFFSLLAHKFKRGRSRESREVFPHIKTIAHEYLGLNPKSVSKYLKVLEKFGLVEKGRSEKRKGYTFLLYPDRTDWLPKFSLSDALARGFTKIDNRILLNPYLDAFSKVTFVTIASHCWEIDESGPGKPWPISEFEIARRAGFGRERTVLSKGVDTVSRALGVLKGYGLIWIVRQPAEHGYRNMYQRAPNQFWKLPVSEADRIAKRPEKSTPFYPSSSVQKPPEPPTTEFCRSPSDPSPNEHSIPSGPRSRIHLPQTKKTNTHKSVVEDQPIEECLSKARSRSSVSAHIPNSPATTQAPATNAGNHAGWEGQSPLLAGKGRGSDVTGLEVVGLAHAREIAATLAKTRPLMARMIVEAVGGNRFALFGCVRHGIKISSESEDDLRNEQARQSV